MFFDGYSFDSGRVIIEMMGNFWSRWFGDQRTLENLMDGLGALYYETFNLTEETFNTLSKDTVPIFHTQPCKLLELVHGENALELLAKYGEGNEYGGGLHYGRRVEGDTFAYVLPERFAGCTHLYNRVTEPGLVLVNGDDFTIQDGIIRFLRDPEKNPAISKMEEDGTVILRLWARNAKEDKEFIWNHFGYVLHIWMKSSEHYRKFISALWDVVVQGPSRAAVQVALSAVTGIPFSVGDETVEMVTTSANRLVIVTDKNAYTFRPGATPLVAEGDHLIFGQELVDTVRIISSIKDAAWQGIPGMGVGPRMSSGGTAVVMENTTVAVEYYGRDAEGRTMARFRVRGEPVDVEEFWRNVHREGIRKGETFANLLDTRVVKIGQPTEMDLPETVNPMEFLLSQFLSNNAFIVSVKPEHFAKGAPGLGYLTHLQRRLPAHTAFIIFVETPERNDYYDTSDLVDSPEFGKGVAPPTDSIADAVRDLDPVFSPIPENCR